MADNNISSVKYTDKDMQILSQLAYINFDKDMLQLTFSEILNDPDLNDIFTTEFLGDNPSPEPGSAAEADYNWKLGVLELLKNDEKYSNWKLVDTSDNINGFYAIMVETDPDNAVVAFRGTQMAEEFVQDLVLADLLLANNTETLQQKSARTYITAINEQYDYSNYVVSGHSLGGNLATHAFLTAPDDMNIVNAYSLDGPGFSDEYLNAAKSVLQEKGDRIYHYQWSFIGQLLKQPDYENRSYIKTTSSDFVGKHSLCFLDLDDSGSVIPADTTDEENFVENLLSSLTENIDNLDESMSYALLHTNIGTLVESIRILWNYTNTSEQFGYDAANKELVSWASGIMGAEAGTKLALALLSTHPAGAIVSLVVIVAFEVVFSEVGEAIGEYLYDVCCDIVDGVKGIISSWVDNPYYLQKMIDNDEHMIVDNFGVNLLVFPNGVTAEDVKVHLLSENDSVEIRWSDDENDYIIINNFNNADNNNRYHFLFSSFEENKIPNMTAIYGDDPNSPFRTIHGTSGNDGLAPIFGDGITSTLNGYEGDDLILGKSADDIIDGGEDDDAMMGGAGNDTYIIYRNSGSDVINDSEGSNVIVFKDDITADELSTSLLDNGHVLITIENGGTIELADFQSFTMKFEGGGYVIEKTDDNSPLRRIHGTEENETISPLVDGRVSIWGYGGDDRLNGGDGADKLFIYSVFSDKLSCNVASEMPSAYHAVRGNILVNTLKAQDLPAA